MRAAVLSLSVLCWFSACASGLRAARAPERLRPHGRSVVLFLVDGLSVKALQQAFAKGLMPHTRRFFLRGQAQFPVGRASFPTLTYPNIASVLTTRAVGEQPVISNHMVLPNGKVANFEAAEFHPRLRAEIDPISITGELEAEGRETATFSYIFGLNAASHMRVGLREGLEYSRHDYQHLDERLIENFEEFLAGRRHPAAWPEFMYMHLVGVDGISHRYGPYSREARDYLAWLDLRLAKLYRALAAADQTTHSVVSMLTADHGFVETKRRVRLGAFLRKSDLGLVVTNESRFLGLHLPARRAPGELRPLLEALRTKSGVELTALRDGGILEIASGRARFRFALGPRVCENYPFSMALLPAAGNLLPAVSYQCPADFEELGSRYPFLVADLARFLSAPNHPDALVLGKPDVTFAGTARGNHGGPTAEEVFVPLLLRNATLQGKGVTRTSDLLKILHRY